MNMHVFIEWQTVDWGHANVKGHNFIIVRALKDSDVFYVREHGHAGYITISIENVILLVEYIVFQDGG